MRGWRVPHNNYRDSTIVPRFKHNASRNNVVVITIQQGPSNKVGRCAFAHEIVHPKTTQISALFPRLSPNPGLRTISVLRSSLELSSKQERRAVILP